MGILQKIKDGEKLRRERKVSPYVAMKDLLTYFAFGSKRDDHIIMVNNGGLSVEAGDSDLAIPVSSDHVALVEEFLDTSVGITSTVDMMRRIKSHTPPSDAPGGILSDIAGFFGIDSFLSISPVDDVIAAHIQVYYEHIPEIDIGLIQPKKKHYMVPDTSCHRINTESTNALSAFLLHGRGVKQLKPPLNSTANDGFVDIPPAIKDMVAVTSTTYSPTTADQDRYIQLIVALSWVAMRQQSDMASIGVVSVDDPTTATISVRFTKEDGSSGVYEHVVDDLDMIGSYAQYDRDGRGAAMVADHASDVREAVEEAGGVNLDRVEDQFLRAFLIYLRDMAARFGGDEITRSIENSGIEGSETSTRGWLQDLAMEQGNGLINSSPTNPDRLNSPNLSVFVIPSLDVNINTRNTSHVALFSSGIPTIDMSLCVPFLRLQFEVTKASVMAQHGKDTQASLGTNITFLGDGTVEFGSADWGMQTGLGPGISPGANSEISVSTPSGDLAGDLYGSLARVSNSESTSVSLTTRAGMEVFTSPQTMVNMNINSLRSETVLDPTQPLMSLDSVQVKEYLSGHGMIGFKRATINMTLHDRTRLREVAHFIAPAQFGRVTAEIEFGWSHPHSDPATGSPYGKYLNSLRNIAKYRLIKGTYNMDSSGQIKITLELGTTGGEESKHIHACTGDYVELKLIEDLLRDVNAIYRQQQLSRGFLSANIMDYTTLYERSTDSTNTLVQAAMLIEAETIYRDMVQGRRTPENAATALGNLIKRFIEAPGSNYRTTTASALMDSILDGLDPVNSPTPDPFLADITMGIDNHRSVESMLEFQRDTFRPAARGRKRYTSLGKVLTTLVGKPLASSHRFDEVQMIFYGMNDSAGAMANYAVSSFPIAIDDLRDQITNYVRDQGTITVNSIIRIVTNMTNTASARAYGFSDIYEYGSARAAENQRRSSEAAAAGQEDFQEAGQNFNLNEAVSERMYHCGMFRPRFKVPVIKVQFESGPATQCDEEGQPLGDINQTRHFLRVHVYDQNASAHPGEQIILDALSDGEQAAIFDRSSVVATDADGNVQTVQERVETTLSSVSAASGGPQRDILSAFSLLSSLFGGDDEGVEEPSTTPAAENGDNPADGVRVPTFTTERDHIHEFIKTRIPTIQFGTAFSPFSEVTISGMSSGGTFDALLSNQFREQSDPQTNQGSDPLVSEVTVVPVTAKAAGLGNPMFHPGQEFYLDLKTGTTADNIFTVRAVTHNISPGTFTSDVEFGPAGAFSSVHSIRTNLVAALATIAEMSDSDSRNLWFVPESWGPRPGSDELARIEGGRLEDGGYIDPPAEPGGPPGKNWTQDEINQMIEDYPAGNVTGVMAQGGSLAVLEQRLRTAVPSGDWLNIE